MSTALAYEKTNPAKPIRVVLVDDHAMIRQGIKYCLDQESDMLVVGEADSREAGIGLVDQVRPDVVVLDIRLGQDSGIEVAKVLRARHPDVKILILSAYDYDQYVKALNRIGIDGYISKGNSQEELVGTIRQVVSGAAVFSPRVATKVMKNVTGLSTDTAPTAHLLADEPTLREKEILRLMRDGMKDQEIADYLVTEKTKIESEIALIMAKLGATSRAEAVKIATEAGLI